jgi:hypothetical protein
LYAANKQRQPSSCRGGHLGRQKRAHHQQQRLVQLAEVVREHRPDLPVLFISGYSGTILPPGVEVIGKPFDFNTPARRVRAILAATH